MNDATIPQSVDSLEPKTRITGTVKRVELMGAVLDVGFEYDALLHNSMLSKGVTNAREILEAGAEVEVWVQSVDRERNIIMVSMIQPPAVEWDKIQVGNVFTGTVIRIKKYGVFVDIGAERPGLVHISELAHEYVTAPQDKVNKGDEVQVKVIGFDGKKKQIDLSIKALEDVPVKKEVVTQKVEHEPEVREELPTAMALAFERAMSNSGLDDESSRKMTKKAGRKAVNQEDIFKRTLDRHTES